jgi:hypothetical protein
MGIVKQLESEDRDRSVYMTSIEEIKTLLKVRQSCITHIKRSQNTTSHFMANYARTHARTDVWLSSGPAGVEDTCLLHRNS